MEYATGSLGKLSNAKTNLAETMKTLIVDLMAPFSSLPRFGLAGWGDAT